MLNNLLQSCRNSTRIQRLRKIQIKYFNNNNHLTNEDDNYDSFSDYEDYSNLEIDMDQNFILDEENPVIELKEFTIENLFYNNCDKNDKIEIIQLLNYLLNASDYDMEKIKRFYVTIIVMAIHSQNLNPKIKNSLKKYFQMTDETKWRENPFLKLCEAAYFIKTDKNARFTVSFRLTKERLRFILILKSYLKKAIDSGLPKLEIWDINTFELEIKEILYLLNNPKGTNFINNNFS